jgi:membrane protease YdiL (CAAX protease family)
MTATTAAESPFAPASPPAFSWGLVPAAIVSLSAVMIFAIHIRPAGYVVLVIGVALAFFINRALFRDLLLIALGMAILSTISLKADISYINIVRMGIVLSLAVYVPYWLSRYAYKDHSVRFPIRTGQKWTPLEKWYLVIVVALGYLILPLYFIGTGAYQNWPAIQAPDELIRLFIGVNAVGIWDELFFICVCFALLRKHFSFWTANVLQAVIFVSFLWELGYQGWGPFMTFPFALLQGYTFSRTKSLTYVVCVHLLFDLVVFLVLVHAHNPQWLQIFLYQQT